MASYPIANLKKFIKEMEFEYENFTQQIKIKDEKG